MSKVQFEVKVYENNELVNVHMLSDPRYDELDEQRSMSLARNAVEWTISKDCRFTIKKKIKG